MLIPANKFYWMNRDLIRYSIHSDRMQEFEDAVQKEIDVLKERGIFSEVRKSDELKNGKKDGTIINAKLI